MKVHSALGPGLLESGYAACLKHELLKRGLKVSSEVPLPVVYDSVRLDAGYRLDLVVEDIVVVELKAIEALAPIHQAQIILDLKLSGKPHRFADQFPLTASKRWDQKVCRLS